MPFLRFSRDKRGYELFSLVQADQRDGHSRPRVLYAYRTPPNVRVGRDPFDAETKKALEQANPGVNFNWRQITETPIPSADAEMWRERRRVKKEAKLALKKEEEVTQRAAAEQASAPGESRSARRRRRRRARQGGSEIPVQAGSEIPAQAGSEIPKIEETPAETTGDDVPSS